MASRLTKMPLVQTQRQLAALATSKKVDTSQIQASRLPSGLTVATLNVPSDLACIGVMVKAGARYENYDNMGVTHAIRSCVGLATKNHTAFSVVRNLQQNGSHISVTTGRDYVFYSCPILPPKVDAVGDFLMDVVACPDYKRWEVEEVNKRVLFEMADLDPVSLTSQLMHKASYREGLGNCLHTAPHMAGKHNIPMMEAFHREHYTNERTALVGYGLELDKVAQFAESLTLRSGAGPTSVNKYHGGEIRRDAGGNIAYVGLVAEGPAGSNAKESVAFMILQNILGTKPRVKFGRGAGILNQCLPEEGLHAANGINFVYSDSSLVGAFIASEAATAGQNVSKVAAAIRSLSVTEAQVAGAKKALMLDIAETSLNPAMHSEMLGAHAIMGGAEYLTQKSMFDAVNHASLADVQAAAKKLSNAKLSMGAVGNLKTVPFLDSL